VGRLGADSDGGNTTAWCAALHGGATMVRVLYLGGRRSAERVAVGMPACTQASPEWSVGQEWSMGEQPATTAEI